MTIASIKAAVVSVALSYDLNPQLVTAIVQAESAFNPKAVGSSHGEIGLMQLRPEYHACASFDVHENIECGVSYLAEIKDLRQKDWGEAWFIGYNHGPFAQVKWPKATKYFKRIMDIMKSNYMSGILQNPARFQYKSGLEHFLGAE